MADSHETQSLKFNSYQTALAIILPRELASGIDTLRAAYDRAYDTWPAHINLVYPFVHPELVGNALATLEAASCKTLWKPLSIALGEPGYFSTKHNFNIHLRPDNTEGLQQLRHRIHYIFGHSDPESFVPHLTIGQAGSVNTELRDSLLLKIGLLPKIDWNVCRLAILVRDQDRSMKVWKSISLADEITEYDGALAQDEKSNEQTRTSEILQEDSWTTRVSQGSTYRFDPSASLWKTVEPMSGNVNPEGTVKSLKVGSYNVLIDSIFPPPRERFSILLNTIRAINARSDVLLLQEVSDEFLTYILSDDNVRRQYPYTTHAPSYQADVGPLLSLRNIVILSRRSFTWEFLPFERRHKGAVIIRLQHVGLRRDDGKFCPLIITGIHLTCGLTDGSIGAKTSQIRTLVRHLFTKYPNSPWVVAGDFNVNTSQRMIDYAFKSHAITTETLNALDSIEAQLHEAEFLDSWVVAQSEESHLNDEDVPDGEQGATFDPIRNPLAAEIVGYGSNHRPQRYDRILVRGKETLHPVAFNMFGLPEAIDGKPTATCGSDHWGVRATFDVVTSHQTQKDSPRRLKIVRKASESDLQNLDHYIKSDPLYPALDEATRRKKIFELLKACLMQISNAENRVALVLVPVGSFGLNVWNTASDIDCLCIGSVSSKTFFTLAIQRLRKSSDQGIRILRKVDAHTGTMLEIEIQEVRLDIQYCGAARIAETWPTALSLPSSDPMFSLSHQTLSKLKAIRDLTSLQETMPDLPAFSLAHRFVVLWAMDRGLYAARFGFLGGLHIALLLNRVVKLLHAASDVHDGAFSAADFVSAFFHYYTTFDWKKDVVEDPDIQGTPGRRPYSRRFGEPMVILGFNAPNTNIARQATVPAVRTLALEFNRADRLITAQLEAGSGIDWQSMVAGGEESAVNEFLTSYKSYVRINVQFWGLSKGRDLIGWIESRFPALLVDLNRRFPEVHSRIWPARYTHDEGMDDQHSAEDSSAVNDFHGCYLIGISKNQDFDTATQSTDDKRVKFNGITSVLDKFATQIRENEQYFNVNAAWVDVAHVKQSELGSLRLDQRTWGSDALEADLSEFEEEEEDELFDSIEALDLRAAPRSKSAVQANAEFTSTAPLVKGKKLRPAADVLSRIRWDPNLDSADFIVGYLDRFIGAKEIALDRWKTEQTDEEFIPQHRVMYFRRKSDGVKIWDRETRLDLLFGA